MELDTAKPTEAKPEEPTAPAVAPAEPEVEAPKTESPAAGELPAGAAKTGT